MEPVEGFTLTRNAELAYTYWHYDRAAEKGEWRTRTVEALSAWAMQAHPCFLEEGVALRDVFRFMDQHLDFLTLYLGEECRWVVEEGLREPGKADGALDYLQLYWHLETTTYRGETTTHIPERMELDGVGPTPSDAQGGDPATGTTRYGVELSTANDLARYPIRVNPDLEVCFTNLDKRRGGSEEKALPLGKAEPTLFQILYGIVWELSFFGTPEKRDAQKRELERRVREIDEGTAKTIPAEEVWRELGLDEDGDEEEA